jgi:hypothetical protein
LAQFLRNICKRTVLVVTFDVFEHRENYTLIVFIRVTLA